MNWIFGVGYCKRLACSNQQQMSLAPAIYIARSRPNAAKNQHHLVLVFGGINSVYCRGSCSIHYLIPPQPAKKPTPFGVGFSVGSIVYTARDPAVYTANTLQTTLAAGAPAQEPENCNQSQGGQRIAETRLKSNPKGYSGTVLGVWPGS